jgi:tetratricopeptide (TPR) repeat protein
MPPALSCLLLIILSAPPADASFKEARQRLLKGNYEEARILYKQLTADPAQKSVGAIGLSKVAQSQGNYDEALSTIENAVRSDAGNADLLARQAELLYLRGRWDEADRAAQAALKIRADHLLAHSVRGQILRDRGEPEKADAEFAAIVRIYSQRSENDNDIKDADDLLIAGLAGCEHARWSRQPDQFNFVLNDVFSDALKYDKDFWPAEYQSGLLLLEKYNRGDALFSFDKALAINPHAAEVLAAKGRAAFDKFEFRDAERLAARALQINPNLPEALRLKADVHLAGGDLEHAVEDLNTAQKINPRDEQTLARLAACLLFKRDRSGFESVVRQVEAQDRKPGIFHDVLADQLEAKRHFVDAEKHYRRAIELRPDLPWPLAGLGLLDMRLAREKEASELLDRAFQLDPFNVRVSNTRKVVRHLQKYQTVETPHFELRFDPQHDARLAHSMAGYLEQIYADLSEKFSYRPQGRFLIELFNSHEMFSGRTVSLPDLHTVGACTGRVVALCSPRASGIAHPFNWARVLRHETVHLFNLEQTNFQIPHWYAEGLAVNNEGFPRPQSWNELMAKRLAKGDLFTLENIDLGFIRPRSPEEWNLAYCQAQLYVEYLKSTHGPTVISKLLEAYRDGADTTAAIERVCKVGKDAFERGYRKYLKQVIPQNPTGTQVDARSLQQVADAHTAAPDDADVAAALAARYFERGRHSEARKLVDAVLTRSAGHPLASCVKARLLLGAGDDDGARKALEAAASGERPDPRVLELLGRLYTEGKEFEKAIRCYEQGRRSQPYEYKWLSELAKAYAHTGQKEKQIAVLKELVPADADDLGSRKLVAGLYLELGHLPEAESYARQALEVDFVDPEAQRTLGDALLGQKKYEPAIEAYATSLESNDQAADVRVQLAKAYFESGRKQEARKQLAAVLAVEPDNAEAKRLQALFEK